MRSYWYILCARSALSPPAFVADQGGRPLHFTARSGAERWIEDTLAREDEASLYCYIPIEGYAT